MTRHDLKEQLQHDPLKDSVSKAYEYTAEHRTQVAGWAIGIGVALVIAAAVVWFLNYRQGQRERDLDAAFTVLSAQIGPPNQFAKTFPTEDAKRQASIKALSDVIAKDGDSKEGLIARYYLGTLEAQTDAGAAERDLKQVADSSNPTAPLAKIALAQLYAGENRTSEAQSVLRSLIENPAPLVSKDQAQVLLAQLELTSNPLDAKRLLQSLKAEKNADPAAQQAADQLSAQLAH